VKSIFVLLKKRSNLAMKLIDSRHFSLLLCISIFSLAACTGESDKEYVARNTAAAEPACVAAAQSQLKLSAEAAKSMCSCASRRLFSENSVKELRRREKAGAREETNKLMRPLMLACYEAEIKK
jgi:hypothetical protein